MYFFRDYIYMYIVAKNLTLHICIYIVYIKAKNSAYNIYIVCRIFATVFKLFTLSFDDEESRRIMSYSDVFHFTM